MRKYIMLLDNERYVALFKNDFEFVHFKWECEADDMVVELLHDYEVSVEQIMADEEFEYPYQIEIVAEMLLPNPKAFSKWYEQEAELKRLGLI